MQDFTKMKVWQKSHQVTLEVYRMTRCFPPEERYGITDQVRRAAVSVSANIAEGCGRGSDADFRRSLQIAMGSAKEVQYFLILARDLAFLGPSDHAQVDSLAEEARRMLASLISKVRSAGS